MSAKPTSEIRTIAAGEFKARCLQLMDEVNETGLTLVITRRGKPVVQITAPTPEPPRPFRSIVGRTPSARSFGDIVSALPDEYTMTDLTFPE